MTYTTNSLNQYTGIANPRGVVVTGFGKPPPGVVTINESGADPATERKGMIYAKRLEAAEMEAVWMDVEVESSVDVGGQTVTAKREGHRWVPPAQETLSYDADGNLVEDGRWEYTWDGENRLIGMETTSLAAAVGVPTVRLEFGYDAWGRRVMKRVWDVDGSTETLRNDVRFVYHGWNLVAEMEMKGDAEDAPVAGSGVVNRPFLRRSYLWGEDLAGVVAGGADLGGDVGAGGVGGLLAVTRHERGAQGEETYWACADLNGNVIGLISAATTKLAVYEYDPFGMPMRVNEPEEGLNPIRFSSKYVDAETGLSYYGHRLYSADIGRWLNRDPIGERGGINLYGMVGNGGVTRIDVLGNKWSNCNSTWTYLGPSKYSGYACAEKSTDTTSSLAALLTGSSSNASLVSMQGRMVDVSPLLAKLEDLLRKQSSIRMSRFAGTFGSRNRGAAPGFSPEDYWRTRRATCDCSDAIILSHSAAVKDVIGSQRFSRLRYSVRTFDAWNPAGNKYYRGRPVSGYSDMKQGDIASVMNYEAIAAINPAWAVENIMRVESGFAGHGLGANNGMGIFASGEEIESELKWIAEFNGANQGAFPGLQRGTNQFINVLQVALDLMAKGQ